MATVPTSERLADLFENGALAREMSRQFGLSDPHEIDAIKAQCATLHNTGKLDLLLLVESGALQALDGYEFFSALNFFSNILPELGATPARMMACVQALRAHGGRDGAAFYLIVPFRTWCEKDLSRAHEIITTANGGDDLASQYLTFALEAICDAAAARRIALVYDDERRLSAITALGRINDADPASCAETFTVFNALLDRGADDILRANVLHATIALLASSSKVSSSQVVSLVHRLVEDAAEFTVQQAAQVLLTYRTAMQPDIVICLLGALTRLNPDNKATVELLDLGLSALMQAGHDQAAIAYVTQQLSGPNDRLNLSNLPSFTQALLSGPSERLSRVVTQWLLLGEPRLCGGLADALQHSQEPEGPPLVLRAEDLALAPAHQVFICRKAIGWFFMKPKVAASVLISVLRICIPETALQVEGLLVDPLLMNYGGLREYLESLPAGDAARAHVDQALAQNDAYLKALRAIPEIKELWPSEHHRRMDQLRKSDNTREIYKQARNQSVFLSLVKSSVMLYGNRVLTFVRDGRESLKPMEMDLKTISVLQEMPRMQIVDPIGLDYLLRVFRSERMPP